MVKQLYLLKSSIIDMMKHNKARYNVIRQVRSIVLPSIKHTVVHLWPNIVSCIASASVRTLQ